MKYIFFFCVSSLFFSCESNERVRASSEDEFREVLRYAVDNDSWAKNGFDRVLLEDEITLNSTIVDLVAVSYPSSGKFDDSGKDKIFSVSFPEFKVTVDNWVPKNIFENIYVLITEKTDYLKGLEDPGFDLENAYYLHHKKLALIGKTSPLVVEKKGSDDCVIVLQSSEVSEIWIRSNGVFAHGEIKKSSDAQIDFSLLRLYFQKK